MYVCTYSCIVLVHLLCILYLTCVTRHAFLGKLVTGVIRIRFLVSTIPIQGEQATAVPHTNCSSLTLPASSLGVLPSTSQNQFLKSQENRIIILNQPSPSHAIILGIMQPNLTNIITLLSLVPQSMELTESQYTCGWVFKISIRKSIEIRL